MSREASAPDTLDRTTLHPMLMLRGIGRWIVTPAQFPEEWQRIMSAVPPPEAPVHLSPEQRLLCDYGDVTYAQMAMLARLHRDGDSAEFFEGEVESIVSGDMNLAPWGGVR